MNGVINFYKESGITSFKAVDKVRKLLGIKKCGHTGTLDPMAEGVLPMCLNQSTKFVDYLMAGDKEYVAEITFGYKTDTYDSTGAVIAENDDIKPTEAEVLSMITTLIGKVELPIPSFSAVKIDGKRAHELARQGLIEDAGTRVNHVYDIALLSYEYPRAMIKVFCEKGTYIRSIIYVLGEKLGCYAVMSGLIRTGNGQFNIKDSFKLADLEKCIKNEDFDFIKPVWDYLDWPRAVVKQDAVKLIKNGVSPKKHFYSYLPIEEGEYFFVGTADGEMLGFAKKQKGNQIPLKMVKVFN